MAAKPKLTPEQWADVRAAWESDPRKPLAWLISELGLSVSGEALRLRSKSEGWEKARIGLESKHETQASKLGEKNKLGEVKKSKLGAKTATSGETVPGGNLDKESNVLQEVGQPLTPNEERFVSEFLIDLNGTQAYKRVFPGVTDGSAATLANKLLRKVDVSMAVEKAKADRAARTGINADRALAEVWAMATADARELVQVKVGCCRYCYGEGHHRQRTVGEMNRDREKHVAKLKDIADFDEEGGIGFNPIRTPHHECPECGGDGEARTVLMDTRNLSPQAAALYAGAKQGKNGIEVQFHSKADALDKVFKHLGLYEKEKEININVFPPAEVLDAIYNKALAEAGQREVALRGRRERLGIVIENGESND